MEGPLTQFQSTTFVKEDVFSLFTSINNKLEPETRLDFTFIESTFETRWPHFKEAEERATDTY